MLWHPFRDLVRVLVGVPLVGVVPSDVALKGLGREVWENDEEISRLLLYQSRPWEAAEGHVHSRQQGNARLGPGFGDGRLFDHHFCVYSPGHDLCRGHRVYPDL